VNVELSRRKRKEPKQNATDKCLVKQWQHIHRICWPLIRVHAYMRKLVCTRASCTHIECVLCLKYIARHELAHFFNCFLIRLNDGGVAQRSGCGSITSPLRHYEGVQPRPTEKESSHSIAIITREIRENRALVSTRPFNLGILKNVCKCNVCIISRKYIKLENQ